MDKIKVFLIDDNVVARNMLQRIIQESPDIEIIGESGTGSGGIIMIDENNPDVVILEADIQGGMTVMDIVSEIKNINPAVKVILGTEPGKSHAVVTAKTYLTTDFIEKPYRPVQVIRAIKEAVAK